MSGYGLQLLFAYTKENACSLSINQWRLQNVGSKWLHITDTSPVNDVIDVAAVMLQKMELENAKARSVAGALTSHPL